MNEDILKEEYEEAKANWKKKKHKIALWAAGITGGIIGFCLGSRRVIFVNKI